MNTAGMVNDINYFGGVAVLDNDFGGGAFTVGSYIFGPRGMRPDFRDHLFVHEYGHYLQSKRQGPLYMAFTAFPSVSDSWISDSEWRGNDLHDTRVYEATASRLAVNYFDRHFGTGADGYVAGSADYFDSRSFVTGELSSYTNPRTGGRNRDSAPINSNFHWSDIVYSFLFNGGVGLLGF